MVLGGTVSGALGSRVSGADGGIANTGARAGGRLAGWLTIEMRHALAKGIKQYRNSVEMKEELNPEGTKSVCVAVVGREPEIR